MRASAMGLRTGGGGSGADWGGGVCADTRMAVAQAQARAKSKKKSRRRLTWINHPPQSELVYAERSITQEEIESRSGVYPTQGFDFAAISGRPACCTLHILQ